MVGVFVHLLWDLLKIMSSRNNHISNHIINYIKHCNEFFPFMGLLKGGGMYKGKKLVGLTSPMYLIKFCGFLLMRPLFKLLNVSIAFYLIVLHDRKILAYRFATWWGTSLLLVFVNEDSAVIFQQHFNIQQNFVLPLLFL